MKRKDALMMEMTVLYIKQDGCSNKIQNTIHTDFLKVPGLLK